MIFEIYNSPKPNIQSNLEWNWRLIKLSTNKLIANSATGFSTKAECEADIHLVMLTDYSTPVVEVDHKRQLGLMEDILNGYMKSKKLQPS